MKGIMWQSLEKPNVNI